MDFLFDIIILCCVHFLDFYLQYIDEFAYRFIIFSKLMNNIFIIYAFYSKILLSGRTPPNP